MKSGIDQLQKRGFVPAHESSGRDAVPDSELDKMLSSPDPCGRTLAVRISGERGLSGYAEKLCGMLAVEKALYTKIELQNTIAGFGEHSIPFLVKLLGSIGSNQHRFPDSADTGKKSYPLCRDIAARTLCMIGPSALPALEEILESGTLAQKLEALDAIGHISFNHGQTRSETVVVRLLRTAENDRLMIWKIVRALQGFRTESAEKMLKEMLSVETDAVMGKEIETSLSRMKRIL
jgi:hypothetical protein